ncbi:two-component regulator propeller domain-containing protein [Niabella yanshanensis]|uniref:histidine kinase n=1 Tax=Niabella yanshanensis TaxID=577386 RepID=A0ABZ0W7A9_9BACT|nr:hybrid sensor histidine kinase/response regulator transcription factor [Niabella yanshanensis]WQD38488.1 two-component regulator propeller domain-containing protein [Niabella yanshanensis]
MNAKAQKPTFNSWNTEAGLSRNSVYAIAQDRSGFIWLAAGDVLNRFDGREFRTYKPPTQDRIAAENDINSLLIDRKNLLWMGSSNGLWIYDIENNKYHRARFGNGRQPSILCLFEDQQSNIWAGTDTGIFKIKNREDFVFEQWGSSKKDGVFEQRIRSIFVDHENTVWVGTYAGLTRMSATRQGLQYQHFSHDPLNPLSISSNIVTTINTDKYHNLWIGTQSQGINLLNKSDGTFTRINTHSTRLQLTNNIIRVIKPDMDGNIWVGTQEGLSRINWVSQTIENYRNDPKDKHSLSQNSVHSIYIDKNKLVWVGTFFGGINVIDPFSSQFRTWQNNGTAAGLSNNVVSSIASDKTGNLWIGTEGGGMNQYNKQQDTFTYYTYGNSAIGSNLIKSIFRDRDGNMWIGTHAGGLNLWEGRSFKKYFYHPEDPLFLRSEIPTIAEDKENNLWLGVQGGLKDVQVFNRSGITLSDISHRYNRSALKGRDIKKIFPDSKNNIWMATSSGLFLIRAGEKIVKPANRFAGLPDSSHAYFNCIQEDKKGNIWFGIEKSGLRKYNPFTGKVYSFRFSKPGEQTTIYGILEDIKGYIWLSSGNGLIKLNAATSKYQRYTKTDGLPSNTFNYNAYFKGDDGRFYFGGFNGLVSFDPASFRSNNIPAPIQFTGLTTLNHPGITDIVTSAGLKLSYDQNIFTVGFALLNYLKPEKNKYAYQLKGFDEQWTETDNPSATYMNLKPGKYILAVKGANNDGIWSEVKELSIVVLPPFWRTWWAYLIYILLFAGVLFVVIRFFYLRELIKKEEALHQHKLDFFTNVTHEIRTHLTLILSPVDKMITDRASDGYLQQQFQHIKKNANNLLRLSEELMDFRKAETENMRLQIAPHDIIAFIKNIYEHFTEISLVRDMHISFTHNIQHHILYFDTEQLEKVFFNLISNAFKFTPDGGKIAVHIEDVQHYIKVSVSDNGRGIAPEYKDKLFNNFFQVNDSGSQNKGYGIGLALSAKIAALHGARIEVESELSENKPDERRTTFSVFLQKGSEHFNQRIHTPSPHVTLDKALPETLPSEPDSQAAPVVVIDEKQTSLKKFTVLVVDDNPGIRQNIQEILEQTHAVVVKDNAAEGWSYASEYLPDIIISDVMMPEEDGLSFCNRIKSDVRTCHIPVILLTAKSTQQDHIEGLHKGADLYLTKPFNRTILELNVGNLLTTSERVRQYVELRIRKGILTGSDRNTANGPVVTPLDDEFLKNVLAIIESHLDDGEFNVPMLAQKVAMSVPVLYKKMKAVTNLSVNDFIKSVKLQKAAALLRSTNMAVYEVCYAVGFQDRKHFSTEFKKKFGSSPKQYAMDTRNNHPDDGADAAGLSEG